MTPTLNIHEKMKNLAPFLHVLLTPLVVFFIDFKPFLLDIHIPPSLEHFAKGALVGLSALTVIMTFLNQGKTFANNYRNFILIVIIRKYMIVPCSRIFMKRNRYANRVKKQKSGGKI